MVNWYHNLVIFLYRIFRGSSMLILWCVAFQEFDFQFNENLGTIFVQCTGLNLTAGIA